ncbi:radical SAM protein [Candidatus Pacearchaeota archaeon]|nr:radical SAM protein [Candidatus Pacearchaeota archaeon]
MNIKKFLQEMKYYIKLEGFSRPAKKFLLYQSPLSKFVNTSIYNKIYIKKIKKQAKKITPKVLQIETTNGCNAKCLMCPQICMKRKVALMNLEDFKKVLDNVMKNYSIDSLTLNGFGEPMIDRGIIDKIEYANKKYPKLKIDLYTNAGLMDSKRADELLSKDIRRITFSINGFGENYEKVMKLNYETTKKNVLYFLLQKKKRKSPILTNISMMILKENKNVAEEFVSFWKKYADSVRTYHPSDWAGELKENLGEQKIPYDRKQWPCSALWTHIVIHSNGEFVVCCRDYESQVQFGNLIKGDDIKKLRNSKKFLELKKKHLAFDFSSPVCSSCDHSYDSSIEWWLW